MPSVNYKQVYSRFYTSVEAYDLIYNNMDNDMIEEFLCSYLHSSIAYPMIRKLFSSLTVDDETETIEFTMNYQIDDFADKEFVIDILSSEMAVKWLEPKVSNLSTISQFFGTSESKYYSQANHLQELMELYDKLTNHVRSLIADRGGEYNTYLDGTSATATMRSQS